MPTDKANGYTVVTYVDRTKNGRLRAWPVRRVSCHDEAGAMFEAVMSLVVASSQRGLYWSEWAPVEPAGERSVPAGSSVPDRALLRASGEIVLDLVALRDEHGHPRSQGRPPATASSGTSGRHGGLGSCPSRQDAEATRGAWAPESDGEGTRRSPQDDSGWSVPELVREEMLSCGCSVGEVAHELGTRFGMRPRTAWRRALAWSQVWLAREYNWRYPGADLTFRRISDRERWPLTGTDHRRPSLEYLVRLAATYGHGCTPADLVDAHDLERLGPIEWATAIPAVTTADRQHRSRAPHSAAGRSSGARSRRGT